MPVKSSSNPYEFGRELSLDELVDREEELAELVDAFLNGRKHFLVGPRRFGKTSLLAAAAARAAKRKATVLRYNVELFPTLDQLATRLVADAATLLTGPVERAGKAAARFFRALKPTINYNPVEATWSASLGVSATPDPVPVLAEAFEGLERVARTRDNPTAIILDEFQQAVAVGGIEAERQLRAVIQQHRSVAYSFAGSATRLLTAMTGDADRPFYRLGTRRFLGAIPRDAFRAFLREGLSRVAAPTDAGLECILDIADDVPYNVQLLAHSCWERCRESGRGTMLTRELVISTQEDMARRNDPLFTQIWTGLTSPQQRALLAALNAGDSGLTSAATTRRYALGASTMQRALLALVQRGILREVLGGGSSALTFEDPLFATWLRVSIPHPPDR